MNINIQMKVKNFIFFKKDANIFLEEIVVCK